MIARKTTGILAAGMSSGTVKTFFILAMVFLNAVCFATEQEEIERLNEINTVAITELELGYSPSKLVHDTFISIAKKREKKFTIEEADKARPYIDQQVGMKIDMRNCYTQSIVDNYITAFKKNSEDLHLLAEVFVQPMLITLQSPRDTRVVTCGLSAIYTFDAIIFDIMNQQAFSKKHKSIFTSVVILKTVGKTGDHLAVMVGGSSGAVYLVDSWMNKTIAIEGFSRKSGWNSEVVQSSYDITFSLPLPTKGDLNNTINDVFKETFKGVDYYDMVYVRPDTKWELLIPFSKHMRQLIQMSNSSIRPLYDNLRPKFGWKSYDDLFDSKNKVSLPDKDSSETKEKTTTEIKG